MNKEIKEAIKALLSLINKEEGCGVLLVYGAQEDNDLDAITGGAGSKEIIAEVLAKSIIEHDEIREIVGRAVSKLDPNVLLNAIMKLETKPEQKH